MDLENFDLINGFQWQVAQRSVLLHEAELDSQRQKLSLVLQWREIWRSLVTVLVNELEEEQRINYLERCLALEAKTVENPTPLPLHRTLHSLWLLLK